MCTQLLPKQTVRGIMDYTHKYLGEQTERAELKQWATHVPTTSMDQGDYSVEATANMLGEYDDTTRLLTARSLT